MISNKHELMLCFVCERKWQ